MKPRWSRNLDDTATKELKADFEQATLVRERLIQMLDEDVDESLKKMRRFVEEDKPNLTEAYAVELAKQDVLLDIIKLLR